MVTTSAVSSSPAGEDLRPAPRSAAADLSGRLVVGVQLGLFLAAVWLFEIADRHHFFPVACIAVGGFVVHSVLPVRARLTFFAALSAGTLLFVLGWPDGGWVLGIGAGLIGLCHLPGPFALRAGAVALAGVALMLARVEGGGPYWAVLGSMFMFRLIVYLREQRSTAGRPPLALTAAYFLPLPNVSFLFFPILDFKTFRDTYQPETSRAAVQEGIDYLVRGLAHLILYRVVKYYLIPAPHEVTDAPTLLLFLATGYALYLRVSGSFHLITGLLHLFGFRLPRTHHNYFLASSFTDIWRRINIYWKDFMAKVFFLPAFFALRGWGTVPAAVVATLGVFTATWVLHAYQVFWLTGALPLSGADAGLWLIAGVLVAGNLWYDIKRASRPAPPRPPGVWGVVGRWLRVVGMFVAVSIFWAFWNTPSFLNTVRAVRVTGPDGLLGCAQVAAILAAVVGVGVSVQLAGNRLARAGGLSFRTPGGHAAACAAVLSGLVLCGAPQLADVIGPRAAGVVESLRHESVTPAEAARGVQGYYEELTAARVPAGAWLAGLEGRPRPQQQLYYPDMSRPADDLLERELLPGWSGEVAGRHLSVNRFGMRDRPDRVQEKHPGWRRIAVVGSSVVMGYGVADDETFCFLLEDWLRTRGGPRYEVLNFGTGRSHAIHRRALVDRKVFGFEPDALFYVAHQDELYGPVNHLAGLVGRPGGLPYPGLNEVVRSAGVTPDQPLAERGSLLRPHAPEIVSAVYRDLVGACQRRGVRPVWVYVPMPGVEEGGRWAELAALAESAGFTVVNLSGWADGRRPDEVKLGPTDHHPNAVGHRLIAARLQDVLARQPNLLP